MLPVIEPLLLADTSGRARSCWAWLHLVRSRALSPDRSRELARRRWKLGHCRFRLARSAGLACEFECDERGRALRARVVAGEQEDGPPDRKHMSGVAR